MNNEHCEPINPAGSCPPPSREGRHKLKGSNEMKKLTAILLTLFFFNQLYGLNPYEEISGV